MKQCKNAKEKNIYEIHGLEHTQIHITRESAKEVKNETTIERTDNK